MILEAAVCWAKTNPDGTPGLSVPEHSLNVGFVAQALWEALFPPVRSLLPEGSVTLAASHDVGKMSTGFLLKCPRWLVAHGFERASLEEYWQGAESDHSKVSQHTLEAALKLNGHPLWAVAVGAHHGRIHGRSVARINRTSNMIGAEDKARRELLDALIARFGPLPTRKPLKGEADLWLLAGMVAVADWIGSNEAFFPNHGGLSDTQTKARATNCLARLNWSGGQVRPGLSFGNLFGLPQGPNPLQTATLAAVNQPGLFIIEAPMGCGKTEAALEAAYSLIATGQNQGLYFALPTQVTSNRIHQRVRTFLENTLSERSHFRLAHSASWLHDDHALEVQPAAAASAAPAWNEEARAWFASARHALLARYGVGTVDQALQGVVAVKHFFVRRFGLAGKVVILDEVHSYDVYTGSLITDLIRELLALKCTVIVLSATLTVARRQELLAAALGESLAAASETAAEYPLITSVCNGQRSVYRPGNPGPAKQVRLRCAVLSEEEALAECLRRAEAGQHVLFLRNTVADAQASYRQLASLVKEGTVKIGLLHSRFPFFRREQLESEWLDRLGKNRPADGPGSVLIATQVVEQSVDIDLDFIVSDLAPIDMLLQRVGRLWRHPRASRASAQPEFWVRLPDLADAASTVALKRALGRSGRVYAPYVLLRTLEVIKARQDLLLPGQVREVLEATYQERAYEVEPAGWGTLRQELEQEKALLKQEAQMATRVLGQPTQTDREEALTRRAGAPTCPVVLLKGCEPFPAGGVRLTPLDGATVEISGPAWRLAVARTLHRNLVRVPRYTVPKQPQPGWLRTHASADAAFALVQADGRCHFPEAGATANLSYDPHLGLLGSVAGCSIPTSHEYDEDDDEFD